MISRCQLMISLQAFIISPTIYAINNMETNEFGKVSQLTSLKFVRPVLCR